MITPLLSCNYNNKKENENGRVNEFDGNFRMVRNNCNRFFL